MFTGTWNSQAVSLLVCFEADSHYATLVDFDPRILLPQLPQFWVPTPALPYHLNQGDLRSGGDPAISPTLDFSSRELRDVGALFYSLLKTFKSARQVSS